MASRNIAAVGWFDHGNLGDEAFKLAFKNIWPHYNFKFFDHVPINWKSFDALFIGGGSIMDAPINGLENVDIPMVFIGVGTGTKVHPKNEESIKKAKLVYTRNFSKWTKCPDLVLSRPLYSDTIKENQILVLLNNHFCPYAGSAAWHNSAWDWFTYELAKYLDFKAADSKIVFVPMCRNTVQDDSRAASYVIDKMKYKLKTKNIFEVSEIVLLSEIAKSSLVITQRFHGMIYSTMLGVPFIGISGHDKMKNYTEELSWSGMVPYYGFNQDRMKINLENTSVLTEYYLGARKQWKDISVTVDQELFG